MPGSNAGTGQPLSFRCSACRKRHGTNEYFDRGPRSTRSLGRLDRVRLTGKRNLVRAGTRGIRTSEYTRQYACKDCDHMGWSRHVDLQRLERV